MGLPLPRYTKQLLHRPHSVPVPVAEALAGERLPAEDLAPVLDHDLDDDVGELDVHDGGDGLLLGAEQRGAEADAEVGDGHHVDAALERHVLQVAEQHLHHLLVGHRDVLVDEPLHLGDAVLVRVQL